MNKIGEFLKNEKYETSVNSRSKFKIKHKAALYFNPEIEENEILCSWFDNQLVFDARPKAMQAKRLQVIIYKAALKQGVEIEDNIELAKYLKNKRWE
jgi:hypothetical protein